MLQKAERMSTRVTQGKAAFSAVRMTTVEQVIAYP
jgi:hypothetical protein